MPPTPAPGPHPVRFEDGRPMLLAGLRRHHTFAGSAESVAGQWRAFGALGPVAGRRGTAVYGVMCGADPAAETFEYMCAVEVDAFDATHAGRMRVPPQHYAVFEHAGAGPGLRKLWEAIFGEWLPRSGHAPAPGPDFELYGDRFDARTGGGVVEVWVPVERG